MDSLGTEVGQKMRGAIKAKLIELGSGSSGSSGGYIDDELPDYVMIMVANKRSKKQMRDDLQLFLNDNTDSFVNWLHQVLEKLQEVTLPPSVVQKVTNSKHAEGKRDKKGKKLRRATKDQSSEPQASITDVFADHLIGKVKRSLEAEPLTPVKKQETRKETSIQTVMEIATNVVITSKQKELEELVVIQKQIDEAKRQLKIIPNDPDNQKDSEEDDDDFLNIKADEEDDVDNDSQSTVVERNSERRYRHRSPIVFDKPRSSSSSRPPKAAAVDIEKASANDSGQVNDKRGHIISLSAHRQMERELYTPVHRREQTVPSTGDRSRSHRITESRDRKFPDKNAHERRRSPQRREQRSRDRRTISPRPRERSFRPVSNNRRVDKSTSPVTLEVASMINEPEPKQRLSVRQRIGSRVILAPPKPPLPDEEPVEVPLNSVVTIKPRPAFPKNRQANKNLLLRAVAEAQKSIVGTLTKPLETPIQRTGEIGGTTSLKSRLGSRKRSDRLEANSEPIKRAKQEKIIIEIGPNDDASDIKDSEIDDDLDQIVLKTDFSIEATKADVQAVVPGEPDNTQFVVTLDGFKNNKLKGRSRLNKVAAEKTILNNIMSNDNVSKRAGKRTAPVFDKNNGEPVNKDRGKDTKMVDLRLRVEEKRRNSPAKLCRSPVKIQEQRQDAAPDRRESVDAFGTAPAKKRIRVSELPRANTSKGEDQDYKISVLSTMATDGKEKRDPKKYDNIPSLLSSVAVTTVGSTIGKVLERCKFYPNCSRGDLCEFVHPSTICKTFPNCKFGEKCLYIHPRCKFDLACTRLDCNYTHTPVSSGPPLSSHVIPVQNYKSIQSKPLPPLCKFLPNCSNSQCPFYHPILCRFGNLCINKIECNYYHRDLPVAGQDKFKAGQDKFKWISPMSG